MFYFPIQGLERKRGASTVPTTKKTDFPSTTESPKEITVTTEDYELYAVPLVQVLRVSTMAPGNHLDSNYLRHWNDKFHRYTYVSFFLSVAELTVGKQNLSVRIQPKITTTLSCRNSSLEHGDDMPSVFTDVALVCDEKVKLMVIYFIGGWSYPVLEFALYAEGTLSSCWVASTLWCRQFVCNAQSKSSCHRENMFRYTDFQEEKLYKKTYNARK